MQKFFVISWFDRSTVKHLRVSFSFYLMPVFLFALSQADNVDWPRTITAFIILHLLIFPSSNGYNSYQDRDETSIGGLKYPPKVTINLLHATLLMDVVALLASLVFVSEYFFILILTCVLMSRAYSYRKLRLKKYAFTGFLVVFIFQGGFVYLTSSAAITDFSFENYLNKNNIICMMISSLFIGSIYPLTQIYQHEADIKDGVISISYKLGYLGTFAFSAGLFALANILLSYYFSLKQQQNEMVLFFILTFPVAISLIVWFNKVRKNSTAANFENTMRMNLIASTCMNSYFLILILNNYLSWF